MADAFAADDAPVREFADRGTLWLLELPENLRGLVRLLSVDIADRLDFSRAERLNRSFVPADLHKQEADLLYRVPFKDDAGEVVVCVLLEHQSRPDRSMGLRLLSYMTDIWDSQRRTLQDAGTPVSKWHLTPILPIVFYTGRRRWKTPLSLDGLVAVPEALAGFIPRHDVLFLNLHEISPDALTGSAVALALRALRAADDPRETLARILEGVVRQLEALPDSAQAEWRRALHFLVQLISNKRGRDEHEALYDVVRKSVKPTHVEEVNAVAMTYAQELLEQGRQEGRQEGLLDGQRALLLSQLEMKFGPLKPEVTAAVNAMDANRLAQTGRRVLTADSLANLGL